MKKAGIITHYYKSLNYGGSLQAYALCKILQEMGFEAEQISYDMFGPDAPKGITHLLKDILKSIKREITHFPQEQGWRKRRKKFYDFQDTVPHSTRVYHKENIGESTDCYDLFITGSDQVWNLQWYHPAFFLDFVPEGEKKIAYAASLGKTMLNEKEQEIFRQHLRDYRAISVREADAVEMVSSCTLVPVVHTLDPTMLLTVGQWDEICAERIVSEPYIFCFLLGDGVQERQVVRDFAQKTGLKIVFLPHFPCTFRRADEGFADIPLYDISPAEFISLIKYADYICTDSFHATVFSNLYKKSYFVFDRNAAKNMHSRILSLLELFGSEERFLNQVHQMNGDYMMNLKEIDYDSAEKAVENARTASIAFLQNNLRNE